VALLELAFFGDELGNSGVQLLVIHAVPPLSKAGDDPDVGV
jgi:hypothetical protein